MFMTIVSNVTVYYNDKYETKSLQCRKKWSKCKKIIKGLIIFINF